MSASYIPTPETGGALAFEIQQPQIAESALAASLLPSCEVRMWVTTRTRLAVGDRVMFDGELGIICEGRVIAVVPPKTFPEVDGYKATHSTARVTGFPRPGHTYLIETGEGTLRSLHWSSIRPLSLWKLGVRVGGVCEQQAA